jgi:GNAT superfamily N-acetyltransferase
MATIDEMTTRALTKADYDHIVGVIDAWWGGPTSALAHPIFFYELGKMATVVEHQGLLFGFIVGELGYVHLVGIDPEYRRHGVGTRLYEAFERSCLEAGCQRLKAITTHGNEGSVKFHLARGWRAQQIEDYAGPGRARLVFTKNLTD